MSIKITIVDGYRKVIIPPNAKKEKFQLEARYRSWSNLFDYSNFIVVCEGYIIAAGSSCDSDEYNYDIERHYTNWKKAAETLVYFMDVDINVFNKVLEKVDKNTEEFGNIKFYLEVIFSSRINKANSNLRQETFKLDEVSKRL